DKKGKYAPGPLKRISAACDCGWRSALWLPSSATYYSPFSIFGSKADEDLVYVLWKEHVDSLHSPAMVELAKRYGYTGRPISHRELRETLASSTRRVRHE